GGGAVQVQNYIDNTGVQVADVVIGFRHMEKKNVAQVRELAAQPKFDYVCWDVYARASHFLEEDKARAATLRGPSCWPPAEKWRGAGSCPPRKKPPRPSKTPAQRNPPVPPWRRKARTT